MVTTRFWKMQPTFTVELPVPADTAMQKIREAINQSDHKNLISVAGTVVDLRIEPAERRFWSPHLSAQVSNYSLVDPNAAPHGPAAHSGGGSQLFARFSPRPEIWTMFMAIYAMVAFGVCSALVFGSVQWLMGNTPWALLLAPVGVLTIMFLHVASVIGQNLSHDQMETLHERLHAIIQRVVGDVAASR